MRELVVTTAQGLEETIAAARAAGRIGFDTEFMRERTYRARLCLAQVATPDEIFLVDALTEGDMKQLAAIVSDPDVRVVVHAGRQDFDLFFERFGTVPANVLDVQVAAGFVGRGASLSYGKLVEAVLGVRIEKGEAYTDWCRRPLTGSQIRYAANDVRNLLEIADRLETRLAELGRSEWVAEEMRKIETPDAYGTKPDEAWRKVTGRGTLSERQTAVLRSLAGWREETAARRDIPRNWVVKDPTLVEVARRAPDSIEALKGIRGFNSREAEKSGRQIIAAIQNGRAAPPMELPSPPPRDVLAQAKMLSGLADAVVRARCEKAEVASELVATRGELEALLADLLSGGSRLEGHRVLEGWRRELAGEAVIALAEGRIAVRATKGPPYVEEVVL
jgi:ribonuclease D